MIFDNIFVGSQEWRTHSIMSVKECLSGIDIEISNDVKIVKGSHGIVQALFTLTIDGNKVQRLITVGCQCNIHDVYPLDKILIQQLEAWHVGTVNGKHIEIKANEPYIYRVLIIK